MDVSLVGKRAWVGGGSAGIGLACGRALADLGASVVLVSRSVERLERARDTLAAGGGQSHEVVSVDQGSPADLERAVGEVVGRGAVHIVVHNTGGPPEGRAQVNENAEYEAAFRGHVVAARILAGACLPGMREAGYGRIINITSVSVKAPIPLLAISNTVRAALVNWSKTLSLEVAADGVTVNNVLPGLTATDRLFELIADWADAAGVDREAYEKQMVGTVPAGRFGEPEEIASAVAFLASPAGSYVNGVNLPVDGGRLPVL